MNQIALIVFALVLGTQAASAFPTEWKGEERTCAEAGNRPGTNQPAYCPEFKENSRIGCVPCPKIEMPVQVQSGGRKPA
jgi:hypothetical protein